MTKKKQGKVPEVPEVPVIASEEDLVAELTAFDKSNDRLPSAILAPTDFIEQADKFDGALHTHGGLCYKLNSVAINFEVNTEDSSVVLID